MVPTCLQGRRGTGWRGWGPNCDHSVTLTVSDIRIRLCLVFGLSWWTFLLWSFSKRTSDPDRWLRIQGIHGLFVSQSRETPRYSLFVGFPCDLGMNCCTWNCVYTMPRFSECGITASLLPLLQRLPVGLCGGLHLEALHMSSGIGPLMPSILGLLARCSVHNRIPHATAARGLCEK